MLLSEINNQFTDACLNGDLKKVKYLLTSPHLKVHANINYDNDCGFRLACMYGNLDIMAYLLTSPDIKTHANIHVLDDDAVIHVCYCGSVETVNYLLTSPILVEHGIGFANIHAQKDLSFKNACFSKLEIVEYLIFDYGIPFTEEIQTYLDMSNDNRIHNQQVLNLFQQRNLNNSLELNLNHKNSARARNKI